MRMITQLMNTIHLERGLPLRDTLTCIDYLMSKGGPGESQYKDPWCLDVINLAEVLRQDVILDLPSNLFNPEALRSNLLNANMDTISKFNRARVKVYTNILDADMLTCLQ